MKNEIQQKDIIRKYITNDLTIVWQPSLCVHAETCWRRLPEVFKPKERPWVTPLGASTQEITEVIDMCPTQALSYSYNGTKS